MKINRNQFVGVIRGSINRVLTSMRIMLPGLRLSNSVGTFMPSTETLVFALLRHPIDVGMQRSSFVAIGGDAVKGDRHEVGRPTRQCQPGMNRS